MKRTKLLRNIFICLIMASMALAFTACGSGGDTDEEESTTVEKTTQTEPTVGTDVDGREIDDQSFYGTWIADSAKAENLFGGFEITFNEDGTYDAIVTEEELSGTWTRDGEKVTLSDPDGILPCDYTYTAEGGLKMIYEDGGTIGFHR